VAGQVVQRPGPLERTSHSASAAPLLLLTAQNNISGPLPSYLDQFLNLKYVNLENNSFTGPIPTDWCKGDGWWMFDIRDNTGLCDEVDTCLEDRILAYDGTSLIDTYGDRDGGRGGYCDVPSPTCEFNGEACEIILPTPPFWTSADRVSFSVPEYVSNFGGVPTELKWRVCTRGGSCITDWIPFAGKDLTQSVRATDADGNEVVISQLVHVVDQELEESATLRNGLEYYVEILLYNAAGERNGLRMQSGYVMADLTPPFLQEGKSVYNGEYFKNNAAQLSSSGIGLSWDSFEDPESDINQYYYQVFEHNDGTGDTYVGNPITRRVRVEDRDSRNVFVGDLTLTPGKKYFGRISAVSLAGIESFADSPPITILFPGEGIIVETTTEGVKVSSLVIILSVVGSVLVATFLLFLYLTKRRADDRKKARRMRKGQLRNLRHLLNTMSDQGGEKGSLPQKASAHYTAYGQLDDKEIKDVTFVITDLENSTGIASSVPRAYEFVQEAHDTLVRDLISAYGGYEINTEGDAFHVAFKTATAAIQFCMEVQYEMMQIEWPKEVLKLPGCEVQYSRTRDDFVYCGPRIRMGIHVATEAHVMQHLHSITKHKIYSGAPFQVTRELCEAASGGQVLVTHAVWERIRTNMYAAGFPVVEQIGSYGFDRWDKPVWLYQIRSLLGKPLARPVLPSAGSLNRVKLIDTGAGLSIIPPPRNEERLTFVCITLPRDELAPTVAGEELPQKLWEKLYETMCVCAMQYQGYLFRTSRSGHFYLVFGSPEDAIRMTHLVQMLVVSMHWPSDLQEWCGRRETSADGKLLFNGPRLAMGVHESCDFVTRPIPQIQISPEGVPHVDYVGTAEEIATFLSECAHGGQIILSEATWSVVQQSLPGTPSVISLGTHLVEHPCCPDPMMLMEVMPKTLSKRSFPRPKSTTMVEPGYRDAPPEDSVVTVVHLKISKPEIVEAAEKRVRGEQASSRQQNAEAAEASMATIALYAEAIKLASKAIRTLLGIYQGYECKEPQPGKFTFAFADLGAAIKWAAAVQTVLLNLDWPESILEWSECQPIYVTEEFSDEDMADLTEITELRDSEVPETSFDASENRWADRSASDSTKSGGPLDSNLLIWRGLSARIGMASGIPLSKAPLNTGRADYFGTIPNLAARLVNIACPGQVLLDASKIDMLSSVIWVEGKAYISGSNHQMKGERLTDGIYLSPLGQMRIKGFDDLRSIFQIDSEHLQAREFDEIPNLVRSMLASNVSKKLSGLRKASEPGAHFHSAVASSKDSFQMSKPGIFGSVSRRDSGNSGTSLFRRVSMGFGNRTGDGAEGNVGAANISYSEASSLGGSLRKQVANYTMHQRKNSNSSSIATTPHSYMGDPTFQTTNAKSSPVRTRLGHPSVYGDDTTADRSSAGRYKELSDLHEDESLAVREGLTPTATSKVSKWQEWL
jgi:class 3 adenylate cyclase